MIFVPLFFATCFVKKILFSLSGFLLHPAHTGLYKDSRNFTSLNWVGKTFSLCVPTHHPSPYLPCMQGASDIHLVSQAPVCTVVYH